MNRTNFFEEVTVYDFPEYDHLNNSLSRFVMNYPVQYYRVAEDDLQRPDLISYKAYQTVKYWWLICYANGVLDPFTDLEVVKLMTIPNILDIYEFYKKNSVR